MHQVGKLAVIVVLGLAINKYVLRAFIPATAVPALKTR